MTLSQDPAGPEGPGSNNMTLEQFLACWLAGEDLGSLIREVDPRSVRQRLLHLATLGLLPQRYGKDWDDRQESQLIALSSWGAPLEEMALVLGRFSWNVEKHLNQVGRLRRRRPAAGAQ